MKKKTINGLINKIEINDQGKMTGGFSGIRGGFKVLPSTNDSKCPNSGTCTGTNKDSCLNSRDCSSSTNNSECSNTGTCFF